MWTIVTRPRHSDFGLDFSYSDNSGIRVHYPFGFHDFSVRIGSVLNRFLGKKL